jgi:hypothetical protein
VAAVRFKNTVFKIYLLEHDLPGPLGELVLV